MFTELHVNFQFDSLLEKASEKQQKLVPSLQENKMVPATNVPENPLPFMNCPATTQTLCNSGGSEYVYGCCPFAKAVCCPDHATCCPSGMECSMTTTAMCAGNRSVMVRMHNSAVHIHWKPDIRMPITTEKNCLISGLFLYAIHTVRDAYNK